MKTIGHPVLAGLPDLCADILSFTLQLRHAEDPGDFEPFRLQVDELFRIFETRARQADITAANTELAKYALVALVDELVLNSSWPLKEEWAGRPLQLEYFNDFAAGEEFYNKLDSLRNPQDPQKLDVLEVYYLCLALGFQGKYGDLQGMEKLKVELEEIGKEIRQARKKGAQDLSPNWKPPDEMPQIVKTFPAWVIAVACGTVLLFVYIVLAWILGSAKDGVVESLR
jgi:type VI secretion system protein ImpK